ALSIPDADKAGTHIAWAYNPEAEHRELVVLADNATQAREYRDHFIRVGVDTLTGYTTALEELLGDGVPTMTIEELQSADVVTLIDVRNNSQSADGHSIVSKQLAVCCLTLLSDQLFKTSSIVTFCASGRIAAVGVVALRRYGYNVVELNGNYESWAE